jgi:hypothetical protein
MARQVENPENANGILRYYADRHGVDKGIA